MKAPRLRLLAAFALLVTAVVAAVTSALPAMAQTHMPMVRAPDCVAAMGALPEKWEGTAFAIDGGTLAGAGLKPHIRLWGIQAPELRDKDRQETVPGMAARAVLENLLVAGERRVTCRALKWDRHCRIVAPCTVTAEIPVGAKAQPHDIALQLLEAGLAYGFRLNDTLPWDEVAGERYGHYEQIARKARAGLWPMWLGEK